MLELKGKYNKNCKIYNDDVEPEALSLVYSLLDSPVFENVPIRCMPDIHAGKEIVIGFTAPMTKMINPNHVGVDIGCSISTYFTDKKNDPSEYALIEHRIRKEIPFGFNLNDKRVFEMKDFLKFLKGKFNQAKFNHPDLINDMDLSENGISKLLQRIGMDEGIFYKSISSVGGGNHFLEFGVSEQGNLVFTIHCGSRNFGVKVCKYWNSIAKKQKIDHSEFAKALEKLKSETKDKTELPEKIKQLKKDMLIGVPDEYLQGENVKGYLTDMVIAQAYAAYNHKMIAKKIQEILKCKIVDSVMSTHNYIDFEDGIIRKGAIRAYEGERMVVPFNMRDGIAICEGKSNLEWNCSCAHGAGRKMSRAKAKDSLSVEEFKEQMSEIYSTSVGRATIDEAPNAYKDTNSILDLIKDTCKVLYMIKPVINLKATDSVED